MNLYLVTIGTDRPRRLWIWAEGPLAASAIACRYRAAGESVTTHFGDLERL
jgi:hypothetical protein